MTQPSAQYSTGATTANPRVASIALEQATAVCLRSWCDARPRYSVSEHLGQDTDYRVCGVHLTWLLTEFAVRGERVVVVAHLTSAADNA